MNCKAKVCLVGGGEHRIKFLALRDIGVGEELLFNYGEDFVTKHGLVKGLPERVREGSGSGSGSTKGRDDGECSGSGSRGVRRGGKGKGKGRWRPRKWMEVFTAKDGDGDGDDGELTSMPDDDGLEGKYYDNGRERRGKAVVKYTR